jgi:uncharacterized membrane protein
MIVVVSHLLIAVLAISFGIKNLISQKGTKTHKIVGWIWVLLMFYVALSSFWIKKINEGYYSVIHLLSIYVLVTITLGIYFLRKGNVKLHKSFMFGNLIGLIVAGIFTLLPGRYISQVLGLF